ncbi:MAG: hypothetical protein IJU91_06070 [Selenomonadaceae bacterium]|nr:hypothetical protein [Selenomonadaceae bacterium]
MGLLGTLGKIAIGLPIAIIESALKGAGDAARTQRDAENLSDRELVDRYKNSTGSEKVGYAAEIKNRTGR